MEWNISKRFEATFSVDVESNTDAIMQLFNENPSKVDVKIEKPLGKMPRKMKKATASCNNTKWYRKANSYKKKCTTLLEGCEIVEESISDGVFNIKLKR